jgi:3-methyladenine DNA glycosylase/8-oxoguanine DNA glycosylase
MRLPHSKSFRIEPAPPFDFRLTVKKPSGWDLFTPGEIYEEGTLWTGIRLDRMSIGLKIDSSGTIEEPRLSVRVFSVKALPKQLQDRIQASVAESLGAAQNLREFYDFAARDSILKHVVDDLYGMHDTQTLSLFNSVVLSICLQMARLKRSYEMMEAINGRYGDTLAFDGKRVLLQPSAERIARLKPKELAKECKLGYRAKYIVASAKMIVRGFPQMQEIMRMSPEDAKRKLMELPGVGDYAADIINPHGGFPIDAWSVDVFGLLFFGKEPEDRRKAIEKVKQEGIRRWGRWSWMAFFYVAQDLRNLSSRLGVELRLE